MKYTNKESLNLDVESGDLMLKFARHVWPIRNHEAPSGKHTWAEVFYKAHGISIDHFKTLMESDK
jgi:hypothetical protein